MSELCGKQAVAYRTFNKGVTVWGRYNQLSGIMYLRLFQ